MPWDPMQQGALAVGNVVNKFASGGSGGAVDGFQGILPKGYDPIYQGSLAPGSDWNRAFDKQQAQLDAQRQAMTAPRYAGTAGGGVASAGGQWAKLDSMNSGFSAASAQTKNHVPANLLKAVLSVEGDFGNSWGNAPVYLADRGTYVNGFNGMLQSTAQANGYDWNRIQTDQNYAIWSSADVLSRLYDEYGAAYGWDGVIKAYFSGNPTGVFSNGKTSDEMNNDSTGYYNNVKGRWQSLDGAYGSTSQDPASPQYSGGGGSSGSTTFDSIWGGDASVPITFEFHGRGGPDLYGYGTGYGLNGSEHTGIDVGVQLNSKLYAPVGGTVTCAGTNNGPGANGGGCSAFADTIGQGNGRIEVQLDNGAVIILGHTSVGYAQPGQHVNAGDLLGLSGGMNGAHVHIEARVPDPSMPSGYRIVDPREVLGGNFAGRYGSGPSGGGTSAPAQSNDLAAIRNRIMLGQKGWS